MRAPEPCADTVEKFFSAVNCSATTYKRKEAAVSEKDKKALEKYVKDRLAAHRRPVVTFVRLIESWTERDELYEEYLPVRRTVLQSVRPAFELHRPEDGSAPIWREIV